MKNKYFSTLYVSLYLFFFFTQNIFASPPDSTLISQPSIISLTKPKIFVSTLCNNFIQQAKAPFQIKGKQFIYLGLGIAITAVLIKEDESIDKNIRYLKRDHQWINTTSPQITELGGKYGIGAVALYEVYGLLFKNTKAQETALLTAQAMITSGVWARIGKIITARERPSAAYELSHTEGGKWYPPFAQFQSQYKHYPVAAFDAFPSGHMATAFSIATVFATQYSNHKIVAPLAYTIAALVGISRLTEHTHWASDVFVGSALGYLCSKQVVRNYHHNQKSISYHHHKPVFNFSINQFQQNSYALKCCIRF